MAIDCGRDAAYAKAVLAGVLKESVFIRMPGVAPLDRMIRVTVGREPDLDLFETALNKVLDGLGRNG